MSTTAVNMNFTKQVQVFLLSLAALSHAQILTPRIIGGYNVSSIEGFEHQVSIRDASYESSNFGSGHICGGTLIDYDKVCLRRNEFFVINNNNYKQNHLPFSDRCSQRHIAFIVDVDIFLKGILLL